MAGELLHQMQKAEQELKLGSKHEASSQSLRRDDATALALHSPAKLTPNAAGTPAELTTATKSQQLTPVAILSPARSAHSTPPLPHPPAAPASATCMSESFTEADPDCDKDAPVFVAPSFPTPPDRATVAPRPHDPWSFSQLVAPASTPVSPSRMCPDTSQTRVAAAPTSATAAAASTAIVPAAAAAVPVLNRKKIPKHVYDHVQQLFDTLLGVDSLNRPLGGSCGMRCSFAIKRWRLWSSRSTRTSCIINCYAALT